MTLAEARILLVDDDPLHLEVISEWLSAFGSDVTVAANGERALALVAPGAFDLAVLDLQMPGISGLQLLDRLKATDPRMEVIFLTGSGTMQDAIAALRQGRAFDFLLKPIPDLRLLNQTIEKAYERRHAPSPTTPPLAETPVDEALTPRERETLQYLVKGLDNAAISARLGVSEKTVRNALTRIYEKLHVSSRAQAIVYCQQRALREAT